MKVILALSRGGSVAAAARILGVDSSTVSRRLAAAEEAFGAMLVLRGGREFRFTAEGTMALRTAEAMEAAVHTTTTAIKSAKQAIEGNVKITSVGSFFNILAPVCALVEKKYPGLRVDIDETDNTLNLASSEADSRCLAFRASSEDARDWTFRYPGQLHRRHIARYPWAERYHCHKQDGTKSDGQSAYHDC